MISLGLPPLMNSFLKSGLFLPNIISKAKESFSRSSFLMLKRDDVSIIVTDCILWLAIFWSRRWKLLLEKLPFRIEYWQRTLEVCSLQRCSKMAQEQAELVCAFDRVFSFTLNEQQQHLTLDYLPSLQCQQKRCNGSPINLVAVLRLQFFSIYSHNSPNSSYTLLRSFFLLRHFSQLPKQDSSGSIDSILVQSECSPLYFLFMCSQCSATLIVWKFIRFYISLRRLEAISADVFGDGSVKSWYKGRGAFRSQESLRDFRSAATPCYLESRWISSYLLKLKRFSRKS